MIHLDANYLIGALNSRSPLGGILRKWIQQGESLATSSIAWAEFSNGPISLEQLQQMDRILEGRIVAFGRGEAELAAKLFNQTGRRRGSQPDCFIAAVAMRASCPLATENRRDFRPLVAEGLRLL